MEEKVVVKMEIMLMADGQVRVNGPLHDRTLSYGLLEMAREAIYDFNKAQRRPDILIPKMPIAAIRGDKE